LVAPPTAEASTTDKNLQFDRAEGGTAAPTCARCKKPLTTSYYQVNGAVVCDACRVALEAEWNRGGAGGRFITAAGLGVLAALLGSGLYYAILALTGYEFGLVAIVVGLMVGYAVRKGSNGRGGWRYQALAMFLTYTSIVSSYVPLIVGEALKQRQAELPAVDTSVVLTPPVATVDSTPTSELDETASESTAALSPPNIALAIVLMIGFLYAIPFLAGIENIMGLVIIGIGLYEAWKLNQRATLTVSGPYQVA